MARIDKATWAAQNPPRPGETREQYKARYEYDTDEGIIPQAAEAAGQFGRGAALGLAKTGTSMVGGIGKLTGARGMRDWAREAEQQAQEYYNPQGLAGGIGEFVGRAGGEIATSMFGVGAGTKALKAANLLQGGGRLATALKAAPVVGMDVLQGAAQDKGMVLPGTAGAIAENLAFSGAGAAASKYLNARQAARAKQVEEAQAAAEAEAQRVAEELATKQAQRPRRAAPDQGRVVAERRKVEMMPAEPATPAEVEAYLRRQPATPPEVAMDKMLASNIERQQKMERALQRVQEKKDVAQYGEWVRNIDKMSPAEVAKRLILDTPGLSEAEALQEAAAMIGPRIRRGAASPELLSSIAGGAAGGLYGGATAEEGQSPLARALAYGAAGAIAGGMAPRAFRFFEEGASPSLAPKPAQEAAQQATRAVSEGVPAPKGARIPLEEFPENRAALAGRLQVEDFAPTERKLFEDRVQQFEPTISRPRTEAQLRKEVGSILQEGDPEKLLKINPARATEAETLAISSLYSDIMQRAAQKRQQLQAALDPEEQARLMEDIEALHNTGARYLSKIMESNTASGRALQALQYTVSKIDDPTYWHIKASRIKNIAPLTSEERDMVTKLAGEGNPERLLQYLAGLQKASKLEQVAQMRSAGLLASLVGRGRDLISTGGNYLSTVIQRYPGAAADILASNIAAQRIGGNAEQFRTMAAPSLGEMGSSMQGAVTGLRDAAKSMGYDAAKAGGVDAWLKFMRQAEIDPEMAKRMDVPYLVNIDLFGKSKVGEAANTVADVLSKSTMRFSGVTDKIFKEAAIKGSLYEQAAVRAKRLGYKGADAEQFIAKTMSSPPDDMLLDAKAAADVITFTNDGTLSDILSSWIETAAKRTGKKDPQYEALVRAGARFAMPFRRTPANILTTALRYAPGTSQLSFVKAAADWNKALADAAVTGAISDPAVLKAQRKMIERLTQMGTGTALFALGAQLYKNKVLTGEYPTSTAEAEQWRLEGKQPESILINGQWVPVSRISPYGGMMTMAATALSNAEEKGEAPTFGGLLKTAMGSPKESGRIVTRSLLSQPMVTGPQAILEELTSRREPEGGGAGFAGSFVPAIIAQAARAEGKQRMPQTMMQEITSRIPGMQETTPVRLNIFGEPVEKAGGMANLMLNPLAFTPDRRSKDPLVAEMSRVGVNIGALSRPKGEDFAMYQYRQREAGKFVRQDLEALVQSEEYQQAPVEEQRKMIKRTVTSARNDLAKWLRENYNLKIEEE